MPGNTPQVSQERWIDRIELTIALVLQLGILAVTLGALFSQRWLGAFSGAIVLLLTFTPAMLEKQFQLTLPVEFSLVTCVFLFASYALGEARDFYEVYWWWDLMLHGLSGLITGIIGFLAIYVFHMTHRIEMAAVYVAIIAFSMAVAVGTMWEIFEFLMDRYVGVNMQKSGLVDTMTDLIINAIGATVAAAIGYFYVKDQDSLIGRRLIESIVIKHERKHLHDKNSHN